MPELLHGSSARLRYEPLCAGHALLLAEALLDPKVYAFFPDALPRSVDALGEHFARVALGPRGGSEQVWWNAAIIDSATGRGLGRLEATQIHDRAEVAYMLGSEHWGRGYATEAMHWFHDQLAASGIRTLFATVAPANTRSVGLLLRLGYERIDGGWPTLVSYDEGDLVFRRAARGE